MPSPDRSIGLLLCTWTLSVLLTSISSGQNPAGGQATLTDEPIQQPIPFSHRLHSALDLDCVVCHPGVDQKASAGLPDAEICQQCHETVATESPDIVKLKELASKQKPIEWVRIYRVPYFVFFSHASHSSGECRVCHGDVTQQDALKQEQEMSMLFCVECHKDSGASTECHLCHELSQ